MEGRDERGASASTARIEIATGIVFLLAGLPKFVAYRWEVANVVGLGFPSPELWVVAAGVMEIVGGGLLIARRWVIAACIVLGATMLVAIAVSGIGHGDVIPSLTLAPALLVACAYLAVNAARERKRRLADAPSPTVGR